MDTAVFMAELTRELTDAESERLLACLPPERRTRFLRARNPAGKQAVLCAYGLLCAALWKSLRWTSLPSVALSDDGKPYFPDFPGVQFSLSHTDGAVMVGLSPGPIGVDIQKKRAVRPRLAQRTAQTDDPELFFRRWVALEACGKRDGRGVLYAMRNDIPTLSDAGYHALDAFPGYAAGVAVSPGYALNAVTRYTL